MARTENATLRVDLLDGISGPARKAAAGINGIGDAARSVAGTTMARLDRAVASNQRSLDLLRGRMVDAAAAGYGLYRALKAPVQAFAAFESKLEDIAQKINKPRVQLPKLGAEIRAIARDTTNLSQNIAEGFDILAGMGASEGDALGMLPAIGKAAVAYRAQTADLATAGYAALDNLKVPANQFAKALDVMAAAGKAGAFELRDMATYFPQLGAAYQGLKQHGVPAVADLAAALQVVRKGTGDASSAATNLGNILQKIYAPGTITAFRKLGVNLRKEMDKAAKAGMTPIEAIAEITNKTLKGDLSKLGDLFQDAQVQAGLRPLIQNIEEYRKIRAEALKAQGIVEEDYLERLKTGAMAGQRFAVAMEAINIAVGSALMPALADLAGAIAPIMNSFATFAENNPGLTRALVVTAASVIGLNVALTAARFGGLFLFGGLLKLAKGGLIAGLGIAKLSGVLGTLLGLGKTAQSVLPASLDGFGRASQAVARNSRAATDASRRMVEGMGAARRASDLMVSGMSSAAARAPTAGFTTFGQRAGNAASTAFRAAFRFGIATMVAAEVADIERQLEEQYPTLKKFNRAIPTPDQLGRNAGEWVREKLFGKSEVESSLPAPPGMKMPDNVPLPLQRPAELQKLDEIAAAAKTAFEKIAPALAAEAPKVEAAAQAIKERVKATFGSGVQLPVGLSVGPGGMGNRLRPPAAQVDGARADGGPVRAGGSYLVGERGPEIFQPRRSGDIVPNHQIAAERSARAPEPRPSKSIGSIAFHINGSASDGKKIAEDVIFALSGVYGDFGTDFA